MKTRISDIPQQIKPLKEFITRLSKWEEKELGDYPRILFQIYFLAFAQKRGPILIPHNDIVTLGKLNFEHFQKWELEFQKTFGATVENMLSATGVIAPELVAEELNSSILCDAAVRDEVKNRKIDALMRLTDEICVPLKYGSILTEAGVYVLEGKNKRSFKTALLSTLRYIEESNLPKFVF